MPDIQTCIQKFFEKHVRCEPIYNEFSLQHEMGIFFRSELGSGLRVQFERPVAFFDLTPSEAGERFEKKEIDIAIFSVNGSGQTVNKVAVIELKYPRRGQYPEQMFSVCADIRFLEQLVSAPNGFEEGFSVFVADDNLFFRGTREEGSIYTHFRQADSDANTPITGQIRKPTGTRDRVLDFQDRAYFPYRNWRDVKNKSLLDSTADQLMYVITKAQKVGG